MEGHIKPAIVATGATNAEIQNAYYYGKPVDDDTVYGTGARSFLREDGPRNYNEFGPPKWKDSLGREYRQETTTEIECKVTVAAKKKGVWQPLPNDVLTLRDKNGIMKKAIVVDNKNNDFKRSVCRLEVQWK